MVGHGGSSVGSYLADPTSPIPSHCASIVATSTVALFLLFPVPDRSVDRPDGSKDQPEACHPRAWWEISQHRSRRCRHGARSGNLALWPFLQHGPVLLCWIEDIRWRACLWWVRREICGEGQTEDCRWSIWRQVWAGTSGIAPFHHDKILKN